MKTLSATTLLVWCATCTAAPFSFVSIGDWGGAGLHDYHETAELAVAKQFQRSAAEIDSKFIVNVGDNFYYCGVKSINDSQFQTDFEQVFTSQEMTRRWYNTLGNHDYGYSVEAQLQYKSPANNRWYLPSRYYVETINVGSGNMTMVFLDSNPCVQKYRDNDPSGWDPCSGKYNDCPNCRFHENILSQDCATQLQWFEKIMSKIPEDNWVVIVAHHLAHEMDTNDFVSILQKYGFHLFLNGHQHELNQYTVDGNGIYVTTGAGCMVRIPDEFAAEPRTVINSSASHSHEYVWYNKVAGFTTHTFTSNDTLSTKFITYEGSVIRTLDVHKNQRKVMRQAAEKSA